MQTVKTIFAICFFYLVFFGYGTVFPQSVKQSKARPVSTLSDVKRTDRKKVEPKDHFPENEIKSPFRYVVVDDDVQFDVGDEGKGRVPVRHFVKVLMDERAFNEVNLIYLFNYLSNFFADPLYLGITVHTSLMTLETLEESAAMSTHSTRDDFRQFYKTATYVRNDDIYGNCSAGFLYDTGKRGSFVTKHVNLACTTKK